ncbi:hypothetical protein MCOR09_005906 [Pyricularia oryzae]|nr:hypothetical protein MCOR09_005906 [Pyricularia oryzae]
MAPGGAGKNALHSAAKPGNATAVRLIISRIENCIPLGTSQEPHVNVGDDDGWTPLCWAASGTREDDSSHGIVYCLYHQCRNTKGLEDDACSKCLGSVHIFHSPEWPKDPNAGQIEPHESAVPEGVVEIEDLSAEVNSETEREKSSDGAADTPGEDDLDVEDLDSDDAKG